MKVLYKEPLILLKHSDDQDYSLEVTITYNYAIVYAIMTGLW